MFQRAIISPSILSADFMNLEHEVEDIERGGCDWIHVDVMDGHFVPNLTIGVPVCAQLSAIARKPLDVHLMISNPLEQIPWYLKANPYMVTVHWEAFGGEDPAAEAAKAAQAIHAGGSKAGIALKPDTPVSVLESTIGLWDMVLVMSVFPGFSGQSFIPETVGRVAEAAALAREAGAAPLIQVDGGINPETAGLVAAQGADVFVAGNGVFKAADRAAAIQKIRAGATSAAAGKAE